MQRLKDLWDKDHPNLNHLSKKHLREQAVKIKKNLVREADIVNHKQQDLTTEQQQQQDRTANNNTDKVRTRNRPRPNNEISENDQQPLRPLDEGETPLIQLTDMNQNTNTLVFTSALDEIVAQHIEEKLNENFERYTRLDIAERIYVTRIDGKIETKELEYVDQLVGKTLSEMNKQNGISLWDLNVLYYSAAVTLLERQGKLKEKIITWKLQNKPGWQIRLEERIYAIRRKLSSINVILKLRKKTILQHDKEI